MEKLYLEYATFVVITTTDGQNHKFVIWLMIDGQTMNTTNPFSLPINPIGFVRFVSKKAELRY